MAGAIAEALPAFVIAKRRERSAFGEAMQIPNSQVIDRRLIAGSLLFGAGWGVAGFCPGPALVAVGMGQSAAVVLVLAMLAGMGLFELLERRQQPAAG